MTEQKSESCGCGSDCNCNSKSGRLLNNFFMIVIIILLCGIFYCLQGIMAMCPAMSNSHCNMKGKSAMCPIMNKGQVQP